MPVKEVHLAASLEELNNKASAIESFNRKQRDKNNCYELTKKLYNSAMDLNNDMVIDQERMYLYLFRAFEMWKLFTQSENYVKDPKYYNLMFGKELNIIVTLLEDLSNKLRDRYENKTKNNSSVTSNHTPKDVFSLKSSLIVKKRKDTTRETKVVSLSNPENPPEEPSTCIPDADAELYIDKKFINVSELWEKINSGQKLLLIDTRPKEDFYSSCIMHVHCVNIPEDFIQPGLSAHKLKGCVEDQNQKSLWDNRSQYELLVLMDWRSEDKDVIPSSPLDILRTILMKWDPHTVYKNKPLILTGGFLRFLDTYPTRTSNPTMQCPNTLESDSRELVVDYPLLDLDEITNPKPTSLPKPETIPRLSKDVTSNQAVRPLIDRSSKPDVSVKKAQVAAVSEMDIDDDQQVEGMTAEAKNHSKEPDDVEMGQGSLAVSKETPKKEAGEQAPPPAPAAVVPPPRPQTPPRIHQYPTTPQKHQKEKGDGDISTERLKHELTPRSSGLSLKRSSSSPNINKLTDAMPSYDRSNKPKTQSPGYSSPRVSGMDTVAAVPRSHPGRGLTGLKNFGNTCYMNSIMQCISNTVELNKELTRFNKQVLATRRQIASEVRSLLEALWARDARITNCRPLKDRVGNLKPSFATNDQQDAHEFLTLILDWLHEDLKEPSPVQTLEGAEEATGERAWGEYRMKNNSVVLDLFHGQQKSTVTCGHCQKQSIRFEPFSNLSLPLPPDTHSGGDINLKECLKLYLKHESITGWVCPNCKTPRDATQKLDITRLPPVLVLHLKRFSSLVTGCYNKRMNHVDFPLSDMDMKPFTHCDSELRHSNYHLYAVSNHFGSMESGHYTASCKNHYLNKWYKYNDSEVMEISPSSVKTGAAYILFYESSSLQASID